MNVTNSDNANKFTKGQTLTKNPTKTCNK